VKLLLTGKGNYERKDNMEKQNELLDVVAWIGGPRFAGPDKHLAVDDGDTLVVAMIDSTGKLMLFNEKTEKYFGFTDPVNIMYVDNLKNYVTSTGDLS
jgi:hypothetical protein